jgi:DeoR/GlpR family transcriptional regulator of sugar metabolism
MSRAFHRTSDEKRARVVQIAERDPSLKIVQIALRTGLSKETVRRFLGPEESARRAAKRCEV